MLSISTARKLSDEELEGVREEHGGLFFLLSPRSPLIEGNTSSPSYASNETGLIVAIVATNRPAMQSSHAKTVHTPK